MIGGAVTTKSTWRWCFWLNLPCCGVAMLAVLFLMHVEQGHDEHRLTLGAKLVNYDFPGILITVGAGLCLLLAVQWGGVIYAWNSKVEIGLFVGSGVLLLLLVVQQRRAGASALFPLHLIKNRSMYCSILFVLFGGGAITVIEYYVSMQETEGSQPQLISSSAASVMVPSDQERDPVAFRCHVAAVDHFSPRWISLLRIHHI